MIVLLSISFLSSAYFQSLDLDSLADYSSSREQSDEADPDSSLTSLSSKETDPLQLILPKVKFICKGRSEGYYADVDFDCEVFHYCKTNGFRFTFVCPPNSKFNQKQMTCDYEAKDSICSGLIEKRKQNPSTTTTPDPQQPFFITTATTATTTAASASFSPEAENGGKLAQSVIASSPSNDLLSSSSSSKQRWPDFDSQSQESHARPIIHEDKDGIDNVYPFDYRLTTKSEDDGPGVVYWNASNIDDAAAAVKKEQDASSDKKSGKKQSNDAYYFTGTSISDRYVSSQNTPKLIRTTTPLPPSDPQPVYVKDLDSRSSTSRPVDSGEDKAIAASNLIPSTERPFFDSSPVLHSKSTFKPIYGYRNTASPTSKSKNSYHTSTTTSTTSTTTTLAPTTSRPSEAYVLREGTPPTQPTAPSFTSTLITSSPASSVFGPSASFIWNQEMGSGFKPVIHPSVRKEKKDSLIFRGNEILVASPLAEPETTSYLKLGSTGDSSLEALYSDSGPLSPARLHELLSGSSNLMSSSSAHSLHQFLNGGGGGSNPFPTQPLIFESLPSETSPDQSYHLHPNLTFPSSTLSSVNPSAFVYETVTISHPSSPFSTESSESSPANPAFLHGFRQYPTISPLPAAPVSHPAHPHAQQGISMMTHFFSPAPIPRFPPSVPMNGNKVAYHDQQKSNYIYRHRPHHPPPPPPQLPVPDHLMQQSIQHQQSHGNHLMSDFQQLPAAIQNQIAHQLGLVPPKTTPKFVSQSSASGPGYEEGSSEDFPIKSSHMFGLPSLRPMKMAPYDDSPKHNFHTQNPNLLPSQHLMPGSQQNAQSLKQSRGGQKQQQQALTSSIMSEINNLLKQNIFTRPRSLSMRPVVTQKGLTAQQQHPQPVPGNQFPLRMTQNPFTSWFSKSSSSPSSSSAKGNHHQEVPGFTLMTASSQSSYPSFADPPNFLTSSQPKRKRNFLSNLSKFFQPQNQDQEHEVHHHHHHGSESSSGFQFPSSMHHQFLHAKDLPPNHMNLVKRPATASVTQPHSRNRSSPPPTFHDPKAGQQNVSTSATARNHQPNNPSWSSVTTPNSPKSSAISPTLIPAIATPSSANSSSTSDHRTSRQIPPRPPYYFRSFYPDSSNHSSSSSHVTSKDRIARIDIPLNYTHTSAPRDQLYSKSAFLTRL